MYLGFHSGRKVSVKISHGLRMLHEGSEIQPQLESESVWPTDGVGAWDAYVQTFDIDNSEIPVHYAGEIEKGVFCHEQLLWGKYF